LIAFYSTTSRELELFARNYGARRKKILKQKKKRCRGTSEHKIDEKSVLEMKLKAGEVSIFMTALEQGGKNLARNAEIDAHTSPPKRGEKKARKTFRLTFKFSFH
jgi:hypothetical protein